MNARMRAYELMDKLPVDDLDERARALGVIMAIVNHTYRVTALALHLESCERNGTQPRQHSLGDLPSELLRASRRAQQTCKCD